MDTIEREVWIAPDEFRRALELAFPGRVVATDGGLKVSDGAISLSITLDELAPRSIALLTLPRMKVTLSRVSGSREQFRSLVARMDLAMHRGGG